MTNFINTTPILTRYLRTSFSLLLLILFFTDFAFAQQPKRRVYATGETSSGGLGSTTNEDRAKDGLVNTASTLSINLIGSRYQRVMFPAAVTNKPVHVKLGGGSSLLTLLPTITVQAYNGGDTDGSLFSIDYRVGAPQQINSNLLGLLSGTNTYEFIYTPSETVSYDRIRITISAVVVGQTSINFYDAYYEENADTNLACDTPVDILSGATGSLASGLTTVIAPQNAINGDEDDAAQLVSVVGAANYSYLTTLYPGTSRTGDMVRVLIGNPANLVTLGVLDEIGIYTYNGNTLVDSNPDASLLSLNLLTGGSKGWISFPSTGAFDRIQIRLGGVASVLETLNVFEIQRIAPAPTVTTSNVTIYSGKTATLSASVASGDGIVWSPAVTGNTNSVFITPVLTETTDYQVQATRAGCTNNSASATATVTVIPLPAQNTLPSGENSAPYPATNATTSNPMGRQLNFSSPDLTAKTGLTLDLTTGTVSGTPNAQGAFTFVVDITDVGPAPALGVVTSYTYSITINGPLPVKLTKFTVGKEGQAATLSWATTAETNSESFDVERSGNGKQWTRIANVLSKGESNVTEQYFSVDTNPLDGENLYRLKMIDRDGAFAYSNIESINFSLEGLKLYPNPIANSENLNIGISDWDKVKAVTILNSFGIKIFESTGAQTGIKTNQLGSGFYVVQVVQKDGQVLTNKFVKL